MMTIKNLRFAAIGVFLAAASLIHAAIPPAENLLPGDTFVFFTIPDCDALRADCKVSPQLMFWNDPAMKPFHDKFMEKLTEQYIAPLERNLGVKISDFTDLPQGQVTIGVTVNGSNGHDDVPPGLILLLDAKDNSDLLHKNLAALTKKWSDAGRALRTEMIHGLTFTVITLSTNDLTGILPQRPTVSEIGKTPKPSSPVDIYFTQFQSLLVVANSANVVESVAAHLTGSSAPALADDPTFAADKLAQFRDSPTYYGWFNTKEFFSIISQASDGGADANASPFAASFSAAKIIGVIGLGGLKSASVALRESHEGSMLTVHLDAPEGARAGLLKILALPSKDANPPAFVPDDAVKFSRVRLDGKQAWAELQKIVAAISPSGLSSLNSVIDLANASAQQKDPSFDLRNNLFGNLGDDIVNYQKTPLGDSIAAFASPPALTLVAVNNPDQVIQAIEVIASMVASQAAAQPPRDFLGHKIYSIALRPQQAADGTAVPTTPLLVSTSSGYIAFSVDPGILEEYLRSADGKTKPLSQLPGLLDAEEHIGGANGGLFGYQNQADTMRTSFKLLKNAGNSDMTLKMFPPSFREWTDFTLLPDFDQVAKYFYISVYGARTTDEGISLKVFSPRPPQLN
jgi:hypothetical protein